MTIVIITFCTFIFTFLIYSCITLLFLIINFEINYPRRDYTYACKHIIYHCSDEERLFWLNRITNHMYIPDSFVNECKQCQQQNNGNSDPVS